jgi:hypothetical protein
MFANNSKAYKSSLAFILKHYVTRVSTVASLSQATAVEMVAESFEVKPERVACDVFNYQELEKKPFRS